MDFHLIRNESKECDDDEKEKNNNCNSWDMH